MAIRVFNADDIGDYLVHELKIHNNSEGHKAKSCSVNERKWN